MDINWPQVLVSFGVGVLATLVGQWIWAKLFGRKDFTLTYMEGDRTFTVEGQPPQTVSLERIARALFQRK